MNDMHSRLAEAERELVRLRLQLEEDRRTVAALRADIEVIKAFEAANDDRK